MRVLGIESSCDELACAVYDGGADTVLANVIHSQVDLHARYGGIVPEVASRDHVRQLVPVFERALADAKLSFREIDAIAVTAGPGLVGSLLCGLEFAKGLAVAGKKPLIGINHLEGHLAAAFLEPDRPVPPFLGLVVSGGHTSLTLVHTLGGPYEQIGATRDDAAGEAFDKTAKLLGLGYPGGVEIDRLAASGDPSAFPFPEMMAGKQNFDFSFSGLKTSALRLIQTLGPSLADPATLQSFCASFQAAVVENLVKKTFRAVRTLGVRQVVLGGGVAANRALRARFTERGAREKIAVFLPSRAYCTDNAAMIARAGFARLGRGERSGLELGPRPFWPLRECS